MLSTPAAYQASPLAYDKLYFSQLRMTVLRRASVWELAELLTDGLLARVSLDAMEERTPRPSSRGRRAAHHRRWPRSKEMGRQPAPP
jgi:hypothetical protein